MLWPGKKKPNRKIIIQKKNMQNVNEKAVAAHEQADKDIEKDPDLATKPNPEDDLDEGELARLEGED